MAKEKKKTKGRSEQRRVAPTKKGINKIVQGRIKKGEIITPGKGVAKIAGSAIKKAATKSVEKRALKAANKPAKSAKAVAARKRGANYQKDVDNNLPIKDKGVKQRYKTTLTKKGPGWMGGNSYIKLPKSKGR